MKHDALYGLAERLGQALQQTGQRLTTAESCTGGWIAKVVTDVPGSSEWFECGWVTYSNRSKHQLLGVSEALVDGFGAVSEPVVRAMAAGALQRTAASLAVAVSGVAGPGGGTPSKPVGTVWLAWRSRDGALDDAERLLCRGDRGQVRRQAVEHALRRLLDALS